MFRKIMVPLDGTPFAEAAVATAAPLAHQHGAELHLVFVNARADVQGDPLLLLDADDAGYSDHGLRVIAEAVRATHGITVVTVAPQGPIVEALGRYTDRADIDLILMATHGRTGVSRIVSGSFADELMHAVKVPLLLIRIDDVGAAQSYSFRRILVGLDGSADAEVALATACAIAKAAKSTVVLAQVIVPVPIEVNLGVTAGVVITDSEATQRLVDLAFGYLEGLAAELRTRDGLDVEVAVETGMAVTTMAVVGGSIVRLIGERHIDLVVLTTRERHGSRLLLRSVADRVLHGTRCALLLCHGQPAAAHVGASASPTASDKFMTQH